MQTSVAVYCAPCYNQNCTALFLRYVYFKGKKKL